MTETVSDDLIEMEIHSYCQVINWMQLLKDNNSGLTASTVTNLQSIPCH